MTRLRVGVIFVRLLWLTLRVALALLAGRVRRVGGRGLQIRQALHPRSKGPLTRVPIFDHGVSGVLKAWKRELLDFLDEIPRWSEPLEGAGVAVMRSEKTYQAVLMLPRR
jgi:hypothetical protein